MKSKLPTSVANPAKAALSKHERTFALEYLANGFNAKRAYLKAKPHVLPNTATQEGSKLLRKPNVHAYLSTRLEDAWKKRQIGGEQALGRLANIATFDTRDLFDQDGVMLPPSKWPDTIAGLVKGIKSDGNGGYSLTLEAPQQALRSILEVVGRLKSVGSSLDELAAAMRADLDAHKDAAETLDKSTKP